MQHLFQLANIVKFFDKILPFRWLRKGGFGDPSRKWWGVLGGGEQLKIIIMEKLFAKYKDGKSVFNLWRKHSIDRTYPYSLRIIKIEACTMKLFQFWKIGRFSSQVPGFFHMMHRSRKAIFFFPKQNSQLVMNTISSGVRKQHKALAQHDCVP